MYLFISLQTFAAKSVNLRNTSDVSSHKHGQSISMSYLARGTVKNEGLKEVLQISVGRFLGGVVKTQWFNNDWMMVGCSVPNARLAMTCRCFCHSSPGDFCTSHHHHWML